MGANAEPDATWGPEVVGNAAMGRPTIDLATVQRRDLLRHVLRHFCLFSILSAAGLPLDKAYPHQQWGQQIDRQLEVWLVLAV